MEDNGKKFVLYAVIVLLWGIGGFFLGRMTCPRCQTTLCTTVETAAKYWMERKK